MLGKNKVLAPCENSEYSQSRQTGCVKSGKTAENFCKEILKNDLRQLFCVKKLK